MKLNKNKDTILYQGRMLRRIKYALSFKTSDNDFVEKNICNKCFFIRYKKANSNTKHYFSVCPGFLNIQCSFCYYIDITMKNLLDALQDDDDKN